MAKATRGSLLTHNCGYISKPIVISRLLGSILTGTCYEYQSPTTLANIPALLSSSAVLAPRLFQIQLAHSPLQQLCFLIMVRSFFFFRPAILYFFFCPQEIVLASLLFLSVLDSFRCLWLFLSTIKTSLITEPTFLCFFFFFFPLTAP